MWHTSTGKIVYDPKRSPKIKKGEKWWCVVTVDREITRYYRWWIEKELHVKGLCQPSWNAHISVLRGEKPRHDLMHLWKKYDGEIVTFRYKHFPRQSGDTTHDRPDFYWFVEVDCPKLISIREELERPSDWKLHITVGRTWF